MSKHASTVASSETHLVISCPLQTIGTPHPVAEMACEDPGAEGRPAMCLRYARACIGAWRHAVRESTASPPIWHRWAKYRKIRCLKVVAGPSTHGLGSDHGRKKSRRPLDPLKPQVPQLDRLETCPGSGPSIVASQWPLPTATPRNYGMLLPTPILRGDDRNRS